MKIDPKRVEQIKQIQLRASQMVTHQLAGDYQSAFKGSGMEFDRVRQYDAGDDARLLDWNVTARMQQPYSRVYREERERTIMVLVDVSASQAWGTKVSKNEVCAEFAAVLALLATHHHDRVGLIVFSDQVEHYIPPQRGQAHVWKMIRDVLSYEKPSGKTDIQAALRWFRTVQKKSSLCFLISDFCDEGYDKELRFLAMKHDCIAIQVLDDAEVHLPSTGEISLKDLESSDTGFWNWSQRTFRREYANRLAARQEQLQLLFRKYGVDHMIMSPQQGFLKPFLKLMKKREGRVL